MKTPHLKGLLFCAAIIAASAAAADYPTTVNSLGPVMYYRLGETTPNVSDIATNSGTIGALGNGFYINDDGTLHPQPSIVPGSQNGAVAANATAPVRYVQVPLNPANNPQGAFTAECWVQGDPSLANTPNLYAVLAQGHLQNPGNAPNRSGWLLYMDSTGSSSSGQAFDYRMYNHVGLNRSLTINGGGTTILGTHTYHVVVGYDGTNGFMYVDGALVQSTLAPGYFPGTDGRFTVGNRSDLSFTFTGLIGEVAYYTNVLSAADVLSHYQTGTNASSAPGAYSALVLAKNPIIYYQFKEPTFVPANPLLTSTNLGTWGQAYDAVIQPGVTMGVDGPSSGGFPAGNKAAYLPGLCSGQPGNTALAPYSGAEYGIYVPNPPINTDPNVGSGCVTFTAWIKRNGPSEDAQGHYNGDFAGIVFERGVTGIGPSSGFPATGLCFGGQGTTPLPNNQLRYHWNNVDYDWDPGNAFIVPDQTWSFVAGVFTPSNTVLCLNGVFATNNVANAPLDFSVDNLYFGVDNLSGSGRVMDGAIDEVAIFTNALSAAQLTALYNAAGILPTITSQPQPASTTLYEGQSISYSVAAIGPAPITYQWQKNSAAISGQTTTTFSITNLHISDTANYSVKLTNPSGSVTSSVVSLTVLGGPPILVTQPASISRYAGGTAKFSASAVGSTPITYQWYIGTPSTGVQIDGATNTTYHISLLQPADGTNYYVVATNPNGQTPSAAATLTLLPITPNAVAAIVSRNPIAYWRLNETSGTVVRDPVGGLDGTFLPSTTPNGFVGPTPTASPPSPAFLGLDATNTAFKFDGNTSDINCQSPNITVNGITITAFIKIEGLPNNNNGGACGVVFTRGTGILGLNLSGQAADGSGGNTLGYTWNNVFYDFGMAPISNAWTFVALVVNSNGATMYMDPDGTGLQSSVDATTTSWPAQTINAPIHLGTDPSGNKIYQGLLDEVAFFNYPLTPANIQAIHDAIYNNTYSPIPPTIVLQPVSQTLLAGDSFTLTGEAQGSPPLAYQWTKNGTNIANAIRGSISFPNASVADSGTYQLVVSQGATVVKSTPAIIQVLALPSYVAPPLTNNLVLHLKFDGDFTDSSINGNNATPNGNPTFVTDGQIGKAARLSNTNWLAVPDANNSYLFSETDDFTVSFWTRYTDRFQDLPIIGNAINSTYRVGWVFTDEGGKIEYSLCDTAHDGSGTTPYVADPVSGSPIIGDGAWHNVVGVVDRVNALATVYVDGASAGSWSIAGLGSLISAGGVTIAQDPTGTYGVTGNFDLDDVGIWRQVIDPIPARSIYYAGKAGHSFDTPAPAIVTVTLGTPHVVGGNVTVTWTPASGTLYASPAVAGPTVNWVSVGSGGSVTLPMTAAPRFFKVAN